MLSVRRTGGQLPPPAAAGPRARQLSALRAKRELCCSTSSTHAGTAGAECQQTQAGLSELWLPAAVPPLGASTEVLALLQPRRRPLQAQRSPRRAAAHCELRPTRPKQRC